ncbi:unnamed protein product [Linum tenue]|nr:unnamed protein product [Linum tenue]
MPAASTFAVKASVGGAFGFDAGLQELGRKRLRGSIVFAGGSARGRLTDPLALKGNRCMSRIGGLTSCFGLRNDSVPMGTELMRPSNLFRNRPVRALASDGDIEDAEPLKPTDVSVTKRKSTGTVLPFVGVACLGAALFGYHLGTCLQNYNCLALFLLFPYLSKHTPLCCFRVVNGALEYLAKDLGIAENTVIQG